MHVVNIAILSGWGAFWLYWLASAVGVKAGQDRSGRFVAVRLGVVIVVLLVLRTKPFRGNALQPHNHWLQDLGLAIFFLGLALAVWARRYLGRNWGMPMSQKADPELITSGPYRIIRHPIYTGMLMAMIGTTLAVSLDWLVVTGLLAAYFIYSAVAEERYMARVFPDAYPKYRQSTKMLIPFLF